MKLYVVAAVLAASAAFAASAQTVIEENVGPPAAVVEPAQPDTSVTVHENNGIFGSKTKTIETTGSGDCQTKTVHEEDITGSKTVKKTNCD